MITLPFRALAVMFSGPKMLLLAFFPGALTFVVAVLATFFTWQTWLQATSPLVALPVMMLTFLASWLVVGKLALLPVEDLLIDECQRATRGNVYLPGPPFGLKRTLRELTYSFLVAVAATAFFLLSFVPALAPINVPVAAWLTAYGFLAPLYERKQANTAASRFALFSEDGAANLLLGLTLNILLFVPVLNVFLLGYAQILTTLLFLDRERSRAGSPGTFGR